MADKTKQLPVLYKGTKKYFEYKMEYVDARGQQHVRTITANTVPRCFKMAEDIMKGLREAKECNSSHFTLERIKCGTVKEETAGQVKRPVEGKDYFSSVAAG
jgi:hypothetical protein